MIPLDALLNCAAHAVVDPDPFLHIRMTGCFPLWLYEDMLVNLPDAAAYRDLEHRDAKREDGTSTRQQFTFKPAELDRLPGKQRITWKMVYDSMTSLLLEKVLRGMLGIDPALQIKSRLSLIRDLPGYRIGIHPDIPAKVITAQFYLPKVAGSHEGSCFYQRPEGKGFELARTMPFEPNTGYAFAVTPSSWHGVNVVTPEQGERNSLMLIYYLEDTPI